MAATVTVVVPLPQASGAAVAVALIAAGAVIVTLVDALQLFASVTVKLYVPAERVNVPVPV